MTASIASTPPEKTVRKTVITANTVQPATARKSVAAVLSKLKLGSLARNVYQVWPSARMLTEDIASFIGPHIPHPAGEPLMVVALRAAYGDLLRAVELADDDELLSEPVQLAYMRGLVRNLTAVFDFEARGADGHVWDPLRDPPLPIWAKSRFPVTITERDEFPEELHDYRHDALAKVLLSHILNHETRRELMGVLPKLTEYAD